MNGEVTREWLTDWLRRIGQDRQWLAGEIGVSKRTIDNWYAREMEIPLTAQILIRRIAEDLAVARMRLSPEQFEMLHAAMQQTGHASLHEFLTGAAIRLAEDLKKGNK